MKKCTLILLVVWVAATLVAKAQTTSVLNHGDFRKKKDVFFNTDFISSLKIEPFIGATATMAFGDFIDYHKSFHNVAEEGTVVNTSIQPLIMPSAGVQVRYNLFTDEVLSKLGIIVGIQYQQRGFTNLFKATHTAKEDFTDNIDYREGYRLNYIVVPIKAQWGHKIFGTLGISINSLISATKNQKLKHEQSGNGSINGGFDTKYNVKNKIAETEIKKSNIGLNAGVGVALGEYSSLAIQADLAGNVFTNYPKNFKNLTLQVSFLKNIKKL